MALSLQDAIRVAIPAVFPDRPPITHIQPITRSGGRHPGVYRVILQDATCLIAKYQPFAPFTRGKPHDLLEVEQYTCTLLSNAPVPRVYGIAPAHNLIFLEDCGSTTLDDFCQESDPQTRTTLATSVVDGFATLQNAFLTHSHTLTPHIFPGCTSNDLRKSWTEATSHLPEHLPHLLRSLNVPTTPTSRTSQTLSKLLHDLSATKPLLGPTDYNARN
ncbi:MAG: hypothetical protein O2954_20900, partial [bacterium]|nr:hypothetical protein [bacterium]